MRLESIFSTELRELFSKSYGLIFTNFGWAVM